MPAIIEVAVEGLACRYSREALVAAIEARDPGAVVTVVPASGHVSVETALEPTDLLLALESCGCRPVLPAA